MNDQAQVERLSSTPIDGENDREASVAYASTETRSNVSKPYNDETHRRLKSRHIQLIGIGGCVDGRNKPIKNVDLRTLKP